MIKFVLKSLIFIVIIVLLIVASGSLFINKGTNLQWLLAAESKETNNVELAFFGSSHAFSTYDPRVFEDKLNLNTFNYGGASQHLYVTETLIKQVLETNDIKLGVVDIFSGTLHEPPLTQRSASYQFQSIDYLDLTKDKVSLVKTLFGKDSLLHVFPMIREHALWHERFFQQPNSLKEKQSYYNGFRTESYFDKKSWNRNVKVRKEEKLPKLVPSIQLSSDQKNLIDNIIQIFDEREIPVVFVSAPIFKKALNEEKNDNYYYTYQFRINEYLKEKKQVFIDYSKLWNELNLHVFDFKDKSHLNLSGATKVSNHLADYIAKQIPFDEEEQKLNNYPENVYYLQKTNFSNAIFSANIQDKKLRKQTGIDHIALYKDKYGRLELIMQGLEIKKLKIKTTYEIPIYQARNLPNSIAEKIKGNQYINQTVLQNLKEGSKFNGLRYNDKEFKIFTFDCPFDEVKNLRISLGNDSYIKELISIDHLELK